MKRRRVFLQVVIALFAALPFAAANAADPSPAGLWKTIDDATGQPRGLVRIVEVNGEYEGTIEKGFPRPGEDEKTKCDKCKGELHDQPMIGLKILRGMKKEGNEYRGGRILDPDSGSEYKCVMTLAEGGQQLKVRGYIGVSLLGRTQIWHRVE